MDMVIMLENDKSLVRTRNAPRVMASLRNLAISLLRMDGHSNVAAANRHHARYPQRTLKLLRRHERLCRVPVKRPASANTRKIRYIQIHTGIRHSTFE
jgi:hypothetical protein